MRGAFMNLRFMKAPLMNLADALVTALGAGELQNRDRADTGGLHRVLGETGVQAGLLLVPLVAFGAGELTNVDRVGVGAAFDGGVTGRDEVVVPGGVLRRAALGGEDVDDVVVALVWQVHHRSDAFLAGLAAAVVDQHDRRSGEGAADAALVRPELLDDIGVEVTHSSSSTKGSSWAAYQASSWS